MNINVTPTMERLINEELISGDYVSAEHVLCEALFLLREMKIPGKERIENLRREIQKGIDDIRNGRSKTYNAGELNMSFEDIIKEGKAELKEKLKKDGR